MLKLIDEITTIPRQPLAKAKNKKGIKLPLVSVVIPCLNEADTLEICVHKIQKSFHENRINGEIIVADNGSTDGSIEIAERIEGVRLVHVSQKGYGSALMGGIEAAQGKYVLMGDADDSYDFAEIPNYLAKLKEGYDLVMGCRLPKGGGKVMPKAMPFLHRWWGNPMFSFLARIWFKSPLHDVHCGMRGFTKSFYRGINQQCTGMEFATEMTIKASLYGYKIGEIPITLYKDGRTSHAPHLKTFRDGWRHLRLYVMYTPRWLFLLPGILFALLGLIGYAIALPQLSFNISGSVVTFDVNTLLFSSLFILAGYQIILFAFFTKIFAISQELLPEDPKMNRLFDYINLERGLIASAVILGIGVLLLLLAINDWRLTGFGALDYSRTMRFVIPGSMLTTIAVQSIFSSFFASILGLKRK
jgi:glycosyltransferase involved in cell wall biosynthesis